MELVDYIMVILPLVYAVYLFITLTNIVDRVVIVAIVAIVFRLYKVVTLTLIIGSLS